MNKLLTFLFYLMLIFSCNKDKNYESGSKVVSNEGETDNLFNLFCEAVKIGNLRDTENYLLGTPNLIKKCGIKSNEIPLLNACENNDFDMVKLLVKYGIDINQHSIYCGVPLIKAIENRNMDIIKYLVEKGVDVNNVCYGNSSMYAQ